MTATGGPHLFDVAVVGAGVIGLSAAYHLANLGAGVVVVERAGIGAGASGIQPGGVRQQWSTRLNCLLATESLAFYRELGDRLETGLRPRFHACGYAFVAHTDGRLAELAEAVALQRELGIPSSLLTPAETAAVVGELDPSSLRGAAWCAEDGYFDRAQEPVEAFAQAAERDGVRFRRDEVVGLEPDRGGWQLATVSGESILAEQIVVAAACETRSILAGLGVELPLQPEDRFLFLSEPIGERLLEPLVVATEIGLAAKQLADGRVLASDLDAAGDPVTASVHWRRNVRSGLEQLLPRLQAVSFPHLLAGVYDVTPDHNPLVGPLPGFEGIWVAAGFSGHGFMIAPAIGKRLAGAVTGTPSDPLLDELAVDRFGGEAPAAETQIV